jgi:glycosyltransferase involved in cell wall biosynthesis
VFIPAWNEERSLPGVLAEAHGSLSGVDLLVIDDSSTDGTAPAARPAAPMSCPFEENRGLREGIAEAYRQALVRRYDYCGRLDADGQHPAGKLARMLELVRSGECDVAVGSRFLPDSVKDGEPITSAGATAAAITRRPNRGTSGAATAAAMSACCSGSL